MLCRLSDFRTKEVVNITDGCRLGYICDVEIEIPEGRVAAIIVPGPCKWMGILGRDTEYVIPWRCIKQIGSDIILVDIDLDKVRLPRPKRQPFC